ncbi:MAG: TonB-dependent receptor plug domain-containing protein [Lentisphaeraceae bacterium]|nr:TonB-dependent receptor plug domain-containing protein [Lentisphaeraceae bacterium]
MKIKISSATLTETNYRDTPGAVTYITKGMIDSTQARSLNELLEIYVPNLQIIRHHWESNHLGTRGIISDLENKYLLLVNGRNMNQKFQTGALSERDIPLLGDIYKIEVIRGPASAIHGPGAISMVVNIITESADTFQGNEVKVTAGGVEEFGTIEYKLGHKLNNDTGVYLYLGLGKYNGSDSADSPEKLSYSGTNLFGSSHKSGQPLPYDIVDDNASLEGRPDIKLHLNFKKGNWDNWLRFTQGGRHQTHTARIFNSWPVGWGGLNGSPDEDGPRWAGNGYQHLTLLTSYLQELSETLSLNYTLSFDSQDYYRQNWYEDIAVREDEVFAQVMGKWQPSKDHSLALGIEGSYEEFGRDSRIHPAYSGDLSPWSTHMYSLVSEYQWKMTENWILFLGGRIDEHSYAETMYSPRVSLIHHLTEKDTLKFLVAQSLRTNNAKEMRNQHINGGSESDNESILNYEVRWERQHSKNLSFGLSTFYHDMELLQYNEGVSKTTPIADQSIFGAELEVKYQAENFDIWFSHGFSKLDQITLEEGVPRSLTSAAGNGYGDDLANWSNHISKLSLIYRFTDKLEMNSSVRVYWGLPGHKDYAEYGVETPRFPAYDGENDRGFEESVFLNLGFKYKLSEKTILNVTGYNLLGLFDEDLNKRNYYGSFGDYRSESAAVAFSLTHKF